MDGGTSQSRIFQTDRGVEHATSGRDRAADAGGAAVASRCTIQLYHQINQ
jgi:hypothetical protein